MRTMPRSLICVSRFSPERSSERPNGDQDILPVRPFRGIVIVRNGYRRQKTRSHCRQGGRFPTVTGQHPVTGKGFYKDQTILLVGPRTKDHYPKELRLIEFYDEETKKHLTFLMNNKKLVASTKAASYKSRWQIELFEMGQAQPEDQIIPQDQQKCRHDSNLGGDELLFAAHVHQMTDEVCSFPLDAQPLDQGTTF